jgi:hypothetical protein
MFVNGRVWESGSGLKCLVYPEEYKGMGHRREKEEFTDIRLPESPGSPPLYRISSSLGLFVVPGFSIGCAPSVVSIQGKQVFLGYACKSVHTPQ